MAKWRVGQHYNIHVYEGETPVCTALTAEFARQIVDDHNAAAERERSEPIEQQWLRTAHEQHEEISKAQNEFLCHLKRERAIAEAVRERVLAEFAVPVKFRPTGWHEKEPALRPGWNAAVAWYRQQVLALDLAPILATTEGE
jgi:2,4-dienoyl-CoA reductase-like NADH-dependent reductase (Old Yellow Enzyme family)